MMNNLNKIMFLFVLMMGTMITVSSNSWLSAWMGLEINLLAFIPLMSDNNLMSTESSLKYFLTQALASTVFLFSSMLIMIKNFYQPVYIMTYYKIMILSSLFLKLGVSPFHFWFPNVISGLSWFNSLILMTWQKIAPFMLVSYLIYKPMMLLCAILSASFGAIGGLNQTSLQKIMAYSSINHISWMMIAIMKSENLWMIYFSFYLFLNLTIVMMFYIFNIFYINQLFMLFMKSKMFKFMIFMNFFSLGGLPPFLGFIPKWIIIQYLSNSNQFITLMTLILMTIVTLFFYLRMCYSAFMINHSKTNILLYQTYNKFMINMFLILSMFSIYGMLIISYIYNF